MEQIPCPDGYLLDTASPLAAGHHTLNHYLVRVEEAGWSAALKELNAMRDKPRKLVTWKALIERLRWLCEHNPDSACLSPLRGLAERIEKWTLALSEADLVDILARTADAAGLVTPYTPVPHLLAYLEDHDLTPALAAAIRSFRSRVWDQPYTVNQTSLQLFRSRMDMLAWRDDSTPIDLKRCWSERVRADFRAMQRTEREHWRRLLYRIHGDEGVHPAPRWLAGAQAAIQAIGRDAFRASLMCWFEPLRRGQVQRLSREGSFLLRCFLWLAASLNDPELMAKIEEIRDVDFKPKANGAKVVRAAAEATGKPDPAAQPPARVPSLDSLAARALAVALSPESSLAGAALAGRIEVRGNIAYVRGDLDRYEVHIASGAIFRASDGKRVRIAGAVSRLGAPQVPDVGGIASLCADILILADDARHATALVAGEP